MKLARINKCACLLGRNSDAKNVAEWDGTNLKIHFAGRDGTGPKIYPDVQL